MFSSSSNQLPTWLVAILPLIIIWSLIWKGIALWKSARNNDLVWYIILLILNTIGILDPPAVPAAGLAGRNNIYFRGREKKDYRERELIL